MLTSWGASAVAKGVQGRGFSALLWLRKKPRQFTISLTLEITVFLSLVERAQSFYKADACVGAWVRGCVGAWVRGGWEWVWVCVCVCVIL